MAASGKSKDELIIDANKTDLVTNAKTRIESLYGVNIEFDFVFRDKEDNAAQQWISVTGNKEDVKLAKDYIKSLSNPLESTSIQFPTELFSPLTDEIVWNRLEKESNAVLFFPTKDTVQINGSDTLSVTLAMSALEDIINHFVAYGETELEPISPLIARQTSQRLDDELRRLSSENDGSLILSDTDRTCMKDEVKRAILECIHDPPRRHSPEDFVTHGGFVDIRSKDKDQKLLPPEHFSIAATNAAPAHPYTSENTEVMTLHPARYNLDLMEDMRFTGASDTTPAMATLELNLNLTEDTVSGHSAAPAASSSAEDDALDGAIMAAGLDVSADEKDKALWTFALDQGYNRAEVDNVFRTLGARIKTRDFVKQLVKNRTHHENSLGQGPVSPVLNENGFPKKLPVPPSQDRLQSSPQMRHKKSNNQSGGSHSPDTSLPVDYLELFEEEGMSGAQLKRRNEERRKILRAALDTEPQVRLNSKSGAKSPVKQAKKKKKKKKKAVTKKSQTPEKTPSPEPSEEAGPEATPNVVVENSYDILLTDDESDKSGSSDMELSEVKTSTPARPAQPSFVPSSVEFSKWGSLKTDSMCISDSGKVLESMPWTVATKRPKPKGKGLTPEDGPYMPGLNSQETFAKADTPSPQPQLHQQPPPSTQPCSARQRSPRGAQAAAQASPGCHEYPTRPTSQALTSQNKSPNRGSSPPPRGASPKRANSPKWRQQPKASVPSQYIPGMPPPTIPLRTKLRYVVIDGSNVAMTHGNGKIFSCRGIQLCVDFFLQRGHTEITVFVPQWRTRVPTDHNPMSDQDIIGDLKQKGYLTLTPARRVQGKNIVCYDDRFILKLAETTDGIVVSNDNYRDLYREKREWREIIENRLLMYSFVVDIFMPPDDPLGQNGPTLDEYLTKPAGGMVKYFPPPRDPQTGFRGNQNAARTGNGAIPPLMPPGTATGSNLYGPPVYPGVPPQHRQQYYRGPSNMPTNPGVQHWGPGPQPQPGRYTTPPNVSRAYPSQTASVAGGPPTAAGVSGGSSLVEITQWGNHPASGQSGHQNANGAGTGKPGSRRPPQTGSNGGQPANKGQRSGKAKSPRARSPSKTITLFQQLQDVFPGSDEKISRILDNHQREENVDRLSAYLLEIL